MVNIYELGKSDFDKQYESTNNDVLKLFKNVHYFGYMFSIGAVVPKKTFI